MDGIFIKKLCEWFLIKVDSPLKNKLLQILLCFFFRKWARSGAAWAAGSAIWAVYILGPFGPRNVPNSDRPLYTIYVQSPPGAPILNKNNSDYLNRKNKSPVGINVRFFFRVSNLGQNLDFLDKNNKCPVFEILKVLTKIFRRSQETNHILL